MEEGRNEYQTLGLSMLLREGKEITRITLLVLAIYFKHRFTYLFLFFVNKGDSRLYFKLYILHYSVSTLGIYASSRVI
ncbi:unnamed protein product [Rhizophagus irregularis]|nr:unnamed protein product [Rhizophagus irregularis]